MLRTISASVIALVFLASHLTAADGDKDTGKKPADKSSKESKGADKDKKAGPKGIAAKVLKVDAKKRTISVELEGGKKQDYELNDKVQFVGPRGGASTKGIEDDRLSAGSEIHIVMDSTGKVVKEVILPMREGVQKKPADKGKKPAEKSKGSEKSK